MTFLHWPYRPAVVQRLPPRSLEVDVNGRRAGLGRAAAVPDAGRADPGLPAAPWVSQFPETNVRTYVRGPDGQSAVWSFSLEAARLPAVLAARTTYWLRYFWADMRVDEDGRRVRYQSRRRWPGPSGAACRAVVEVGGPFGVDGLGELDHFLTARYVLYTVVAGRLVYACRAPRHGPLTRAPEWSTWRRTSSKRRACPHPEASPWSTTRLGSRSYRRLEAGADLTGRPHYPAVTLASPRRDPRWQIGRAAAPTG